MKKKLKKKLFNYILRDNVRLQQSPHKDLSFFCLAQIY